MKFFKLSFSNQSRLRLQSDIDLFKDEINSKGVLDVTDIKDTIISMLNEAKKKSEQNNIEYGWKLLNRARSMKILGLQNQKLTSEANLILKESTKLKEWRAAAVSKLLLDKDAKDLKPDLQPYDVFLAAIIRDGNYDNEAYKITLRAKQLWVVTILTIFIIAVLYILSAYKILEAPLDNPVKLATVQLFGVFGAIFSILRNLSGESLAGSIPEQRSVWLNTLMRPLIGACAALVAYILFVGGIFSSEITGSKFAVYLISFVSGFSESFVIQALQKLEKKSL